MDKGNEALPILFNVETEIPLFLPSDFKEENYTGIMAQVISSERETSTVIETRAVPKDPWGAKVGKPTFKNGIYQDNATVNVYPPYDGAGEIAVLEVTLIGIDGRKQVATRLLKVGTAH